MLDAKIQKKALDYKIEEKIKQISRKFFIFEGWNNGRNLFLSFLFVLKYFLS